MNAVLLNTQVIVYLFSEGLLLLLSIVLFLKSIKLLRYWDFTSFSQRQLKLEKEGYLVATIATLLFILKLILTTFFVNTIDNLSLIVPGAMCGAGVISVNSYGMKLLFVKLVVNFSLLLFLVVNSYDLREKTYPLFRYKSWVLLITSVVIFIEFYLDIAYFTHFDLSAPVSCCSALFGNLEGANPLPFGLSVSLLLLLFYLLFAGAEISLILESKAGALFTLSLFGFLAYYSVVYYFGTYIYELPTHKCPFCMFQKEYYFVGYLLWGSLFFGLFFGLIWVILAIVGYNIKKAKQSAMALLAIFAALCSLYVAHYYLKNGVFL